MGPIKSEERGMNGQIGVTAGDSSQALTGVTRRQWFRVAAGGCAGLALGALVDVEAVRASTQKLKLSDVTEFTTSCNFCSCGCGMIGGKKSEPIMLAIAAVTLSTMHQSSLGSLFLLMPEQLAPQWWSPVMPISFFLSSIAAGTSVVVLVEMWIAKAWGRRLRLTQLSAMAKISFWSLLCYWTFRLGDMAVRGQFSNAFSGRLGALFAAEILVGGVLPLALLARARLRAHPAVLFLGTALAAGGVVFNRLNVVIVAMNLKGAMPQFAPASYTPSVFEWGVTVGLIAASIFLFGLGARLMPILPKDETAHQ